MPVAIEILVGSGLEDGGWGYVERASCFIVRRVTGLAEGFGIWDETTWLRWCRGWGSGFSLQGFRILVDPPLDQGLGVSEVRKLWVGG